ncbi:MAG: HRDC domain-containing protein [Candidatus Omnitrophica bacterium]|nr:HRDC domain-containing protein [Candidatus Omnitrophota bacterium]
MMYWARRSRSSRYKEKEIAFDVEGNSLYSYHSRICLIQVSTRNQNFIIDVLKIRDISPLKEVFFNQGVLKVLHGSVYDIRMLYHCAGIQITNLFDTEISARFLGEKKTSLATMVEKHFNVKLKKQYQKSNWAIRPLTAEMLEYAVNDTKYLLSLKDRLMEKLVETNRLEWVIEECEALACSVSQPQEEKKKIIKGAGKIPEKKIKAVEAIAEIREKIAREKDIPAFKVLDKDTILKIAATDDINLRKLETITAKNRFIENKHLAEMLEKIKRSRCAKQENRRTFHRHKKTVNPEFSRRVELLQQWRNSKAEKLGIQSYLVLSHSQIVSLADSNIETIHDIENNRHLRKWQKIEFGREILSLFQG